MLKGLESVTVAFASLYFALVVSAQQFPIDSNKAGIKKPPINYTPTSIKSFHDTPFANWSNFTKSVIDESAGVTFGEVNKFDGDQLPLLKRILQENFFRIFRLNLFKECPFWSGSSGFCTDRSCAVDTISDWNDLPDIWQPEALGALANVSAAPKTQKDQNKDYCELDEINDETVFVDLIENPERFTGYGGDQSFQIWKLIYSENCFNLGHDQCMEKNFFYKLISGMHASISTHLSHGFIDLKTKQYGPNLQQFMFRVGNFPDRIENIYLNYILVLKALIKLESLGILDSLEYCDDAHFKQSSTEIKGELGELIKPSYQLGNNSNTCLFDENALFQSDNAGEIKDEFKVNFRNVSKLMDCVGCDRCRLWGKIETIGYGTALKVLFDLQDTENLEPSKYDITKVELVALVNTFGGLSKSVEAIKEFKDMYDEALVEESMGVKTKADKKYVSNMDTFERKDEMIDFTDPNVFESAGSSSQSPSEYDDIVFPPQSGPSAFKEAIYTELNNVWKTLQLIFHAYRIFPKIVYNWCLIRVVYYWNRFIGHVQEDFDVNRLYHEEL